MVNFGKIIDYIGKNISRLKTVGILLLLVLFGLSVLRNGCDREQAGKLVEKLTGLNIQNDILKKDISERDSLINASEHYKGILRDSLKQSQQQVKSLQSKYANLMAKFEGLSDSLIKVSTDSSYSFLIHTAYPYTGTYKYPFNEPQVKGIHLTYLQNKSLLGLNENLLSQNNELTHQLAVKDTIMSESEKSMALMKSTRTDLEKVISNKDEEIALKDKEAKKQKRRQIIKTTTVAIVVGIISFLAGGG